MAEAKCAHPIASALRPGSRRGLQAHNTAAVSVKVRDPRARTNASAVTRDASMLDPHFGLNVALCGKT